MDFDKIEEEHKEVIEDLGACPISAMNTVEAMQDGDCMCIGLQVQRPEAAIADPSRLIIQDIFPTYFSADSFLESAKFKIDAAGGDGAQATGGFKEYEGQLALGLGRENITGIMPLYLFKEHWNLAKRKVQPVFGFMCTLDVMGYKSEQFFTIPFSVLLKAMQKVAQDPKEVNKTMLQQIQETCSKIIEINQTFREDLVTKFIEFSTK